MIAQRRSTRIVTVGSISIGGDSPIAIQSMTNTLTTDIDATCSQIQQLEKAGCDIIRVAVPDSESAHAFKVLVSSCRIPLVADIHFDYRLALSAIENGAAKIRINPGNIGSKGLDDIIDCAKTHHVPIRLGVNGGSPDKELLKLCKDKDEALLKSIISYIGYFEQRGFGDIVLSIKSSDVVKTILLNEKLSQQCDYPLHVGLTEAGVPEVGIVKNSVAISTLLLKGIGDTVRVSLTGNPLQEVAVAKEILRSVGLGVTGVEFVSCPKCGRCVVDIEDIAARIYTYVKDLKSDIKVAVMGCEVNGPGECSDADIGLAGGKRIAFFKKGKIYRLVEPQYAVEEFLKEIDELVK